MKRSQDIATPERHKHDLPRPSRAGQRPRAFLRDEDGSLIVFSLMVFVLMLTISGLAVDIMRFETNRTKLQNTVDRAALASASLTQTLAPSVVVADYFTKAGMDTFLKSVEVEEGFNYRQVDIKTEINVPTHFFNMVGIPVLAAPANAIAQEAIGNVEIALVLDVSGSMGSYNRLTNLKSASEDFIDTVFAASEDGSVSASIVPYAEQVSASPELMSHFNLGTNTHNFSHCVNFTTDDYTTATMSTTTEMEQTLHFDPWSTESIDSWWDVGDGLPKPPCPVGSSRDIVSWSLSPTDLKAKVNGFSAGGNTSTDVGLKWGAALLDPSLQGVLTDMVASGDVDGALAGRPLPYTNEDVMKIIVVMTDGVNTNQHYMSPPYREGDTAVYRHMDAGVPKLSIWAGEGQPVQDPQPECTKWTGKGTCKKWEVIASEDWYIVHTDSWAVSAHGGNDAVRLTWPELWQIVPVEYFTDRILADMGASYSERNAIEAAMDYHGNSTKNARMSSICSAAKAQGITIFAVGLEISDSSATMMENCASSSAHFFRVEGLDIGYAFQAIASQINQLRLIQ